MSNKFVSQLNTLSDNYGARKKGKALGRGIGSGKGKTSARGGKGQTARSGVAINGFEGGQNPLYRRLPMRGFKNPTRVEYEAVNFAALQEFIDLGKLSPEAIDVEALRKCGLLKGKSARVKVLGSGVLKQKVSIKAHAISKSAQEVLTKLGASFEIVG